MSNMSHIYCRWADEKPGFLFILIAIFLWMPQSLLAQVSETGSIGGFEAKFIDVNDVRTRYYEVGDGEPMVLVHGSGFSGSASANTWLPVLSDLSERFYVFAPDKLASGMTDNPADDRDISLDGEVRHMVEFIQTLGFDQVHLVGQSRGAGLAFALAVRHPEMVETLVLVDSETASPPVGDYEARRNVARTDCEPLSGAEQIRCGWEALSYSASHVTEEFVAAAVFMDSLPKSEETQRRMWSGGNNPYVTEWMYDLHTQVQEEGTLQMPVLLYWGRNDPTAWLPSGLALYDVIGEKNPNVRMIIANKAGHFHYREYPEEFSRNVINFIDHWSSK